MNEHKQILEMIYLQKSLNDATNGLGWEAGLTKNDKIIDWNRCIYMEAAELIESFSWKHWKSINQEPDWANIKIEAVDIWHFILSLLIQEYKLQNLGSLEDLAKHITTQDKFGPFSSDGVTPETPMFEIIGMVEDVMRDSLNTTDINQLINNFLHMSLHCGVNLQELYTLYIGKNILNKFRQDNGYKDGTYIKIWNGVEDNIVMLDIMAKNPTFTSDELFSGLGEVYNEL